MGGRVRRPRGPGHRRASGRGPPVESKTLAALPPRSGSSPGPHRQARRDPDRNGRPLAYTDEARALTFLPQAVRAATEAARKHQRDPKLPMRPPGSRATPRGVEALGGSISEADLLAKLNGQDKFVYLARSVATDVAARIVADYPRWVPIRRTCGSTRRFTGRQRRR